MHYIWPYKIYFLTACFVFFTACFSSDSEKFDKFCLTNEEYYCLEKFFRYFMLYETAIYTLLGSKPLTEMSICYLKKPEEQLRKEKPEEYLYFLLNRNHKKDMEFYKKLSPIEKKEKAYLIYDKDFIYNIEDLWDEWEKIKPRFPIHKKRTLEKLLEGSVS